MTSRIAAKKKDLLVLHTFQSVRVVFELIFLEIFLAIISLPLYFMVSSKGYGAGTKAGSDYIMRKFLTFTVIALFAAAWVVKLAIFTFFADGNRMSYSIGNVSAKNPDANVVSHKVITAPVDGSVAPPAIDDIRTNADGTLTVDGTAEPDAVVGVLVFADDKTGSAENLELLIGIADKNGVWKAGNEPSSFAFVPGDYRLQAFRFDEEKNVKSFPSGAEKVTVSKSMNEIAVEQIDLVLNVLIAAAVLMALLLLLLTL